MGTKKRIRIIDTTLRDGMHAVSHSFSTEDMAAIASALEKAGVDTIEVSHGDGLGGSSYQYGFSKATDEEYLKAVSAVLQKRKTKLAILLLPGIGTKKDLEMAIDCGAQVARIATHVTEADVSPQHIEMAKKRGLETIGFLMMAHMAEPAKVLEQAKMMEHYGADIVYVTDSAGALTPQHVRERVGALYEELQVKVGFHAHNNLGLAIGNTIAAIEAGATVVDGTLGGLGAGAGNAPLEVLVASLDKSGYETGIDLYKAIDACENEVKPRAHRMPSIDGTSLMLGYAGVYSSFLLHSHKAAERFAIDTRDLLVKLGEMGVVGGQEDLIVDVAYKMRRERNI